MDLSPEKKDWSPPKIGWLGIFLLVGLALGGAGGWFEGIQKGRQAVRVEAVKGGHARYKVIDDLGNTQFEWLPSPTPTNGAAAKQQ